MKLIESEISSKVSEKRALAVLAKAGEVGFAKSHWKVLTMTAACLCETQPAWMGMGVKIEAELVAVGVVMGG